MIMRFILLVLKDENSYRMFYAGRSRAEGKVYNVAIGVAESLDEGKSFSKKFKSPIMSRSEFDPWMVGPCSVIRENSLWKMWYTSGIGWTSDLSHSIYNIKFATSRDGLNWERNGITAIDHRDTETNLAVPTVWKNKDIYHMWYCNFVNGSYGIGYANSNDGIHWKRLDSEAFVLNRLAQDSLAYPHVFEYKGRVFLVCSVGNYGSNGLGIFSCDIN